MRASRGYYDPRSKRLRIVSGTTPDALSEIVLAHELTHALEDQRFGLALKEGESDDAALARLALVEGSATLVMQQYLLRHIGAGQALSGALGSALQTGPELPKFLEDQLIFPYLGGLAFVQALQAQGGGSWKLVDLADRVRRAREHRADPAPGEVGRGRRAAALCGWTSTLGDDWRRAARGTWGEWQTRELLGGDADEAAAGWGGDRYELWQRGACAKPPCRENDVLAMKWRWDTEKDAREFETRAARRRGRERCRRAAGRRHRHVRAGGRCGARAPRRLGRLAPAELRPVGALRRRAVDQVVETVVDVGKDLRLLRLGQVAVLDGLVEPGRQPSPSARP